MFMEDYHQDQEEVDPYPFLEDGKFRAGPKAPPKKVKRLDTYETLDHITEDSSKITQRACHICHKAFSSDKGLGGHMRIHARKAEKRIEPLKSKKSYDYDLHGLIKKPICSICGREFSSLKSLYGHMRCHPNRNWRGINPPKSPFSCSSPQKMEVTSRENSEPDLKKECLKDWEVKARRGQKGRMVKSRKTHQLNLGNDLEAVDDLMMLARDRKYRVGDMKRRKRLNHCDIKPAKRVEESSKTLDFDLNELPSSVSEDEGAV